MGDRTTVYFTLGGKLTREAYDELLELIEQEDYIQDNEITETGDVRTALVEEKRFDIWIEEANYGNADPFPDFARQHGLAFEHRWGSGGGFGPGGIIHAPGEEDLEYKGTFDDGPALTASELKRMTPDQIQQWIDRVEKPLPPLELDF